MDGARLLAHSKGAQFVSRDDLVQYVPPPATESWKPVSHNELATTLIQVMESRSLFIEQEQYVVDKNGARMFGTFDLQWQKMEEFTAALGFRHAVDRSMSIQIAVGLRVFVCSNLSFSGEMIAVRKHTSKLDLGKELDAAMYDYIKGFRRLLDDIQVQKETVMEERKAKTLIYDIFRQKIMPVRLFHPVVTDWETRAKQESPTGWLLHNVCTQQLHALAPAPKFQATARLGKFLASKF